jgi:protein-S-isoprenylcysteine O-methyltransferase Ste14
MPDKIFALLRSFCFGAVFIALQVWLLPRWLGLPGSLDAPREQPLRWLGLAPVAAGSVLVLSCVWRFGTTGHGTPAPFDPPRRLVTRGPYNYVRNPMYLGMALALIGEAILFAEPRRVIFIYALVLVAITNLFVILYEEPTLRAKFGAEYERYCAAVPRWIPRWRARPGSR